jgi:hypothetical protein
MANPTVLNLYTLHGHWKVEAHSTGELRVLLFVPLEQKEAIQAIDHLVEESARKNDLANEQIANIGNPQPAPGVEVPPDAAAPSLVNKAILWAMAEASQLMHGPLEDAAYQARIDACKACDAFDPKQAPQIGFCKACGCGQNARAELSVKARMPGATCPKNKWTPLTVATEAKS